MENPPSPKETLSQFEKLLAGLARAGVDFAVVGGVAVVLNGFNRNTNDVDIIVDPNPANLTRLLDYLKTWGEGWARELGISDFNTTEMGSIRIHEEFDLDVFVRMRERSLNDFRPRLCFLQSDDVRIPYLSAEDLIYCKATSWREKDQLDISALKIVIDRESNRPKS